MKHWFHEIGAKGPDWFLDLEVRPEDAARLRECVRGIELPGFKRYEARGARGYIRGAIGDHDWYSDEHGFERFVGNVTGASPTNVWIYNSISVEAHELRLERGYGGREHAEGGVLADSEARVLRAVLDEDGIEVVRWSVYAGGQGYEPAMVREGTGKQSLRAYLE